MKVTFIRSAVSIVSIFVAACSEPEITPIDNQPEPNEPGQQLTDVTVRFLELDAVISENNPQGQSLSIKLSGPLQAAGTFEILLNSTGGAYGTHFITIPAATAGSVVFTPAVGEELLTLQVLPVDNTVITGEVSVSASIVHTSGSIKLGSQVSDRVRIADDELTNKPRGFQSFDGRWGLQRTIEYDELGRIARVQIQESTPMPRVRTETYLYNALGNLVKINKYPNHDVVYTWADSRITRSEVVEFNVVKQYTEYDYDEFGHVAGQATWHLQPSGEFKQTSIVVYLYFTNGDLYKALTYVIPAGEDQEPVLNTTRTFDSYLDEVNHFPMVDILPTVNSQPRLPASYTLETQGMTFSYAISYTFDDNRFVQSRTASGGGASEVTTYQYY
jgi:hypothetical protein